MREGTSYAKVWPNSGGVRPNSGAVRINCGGAKRRAGRSRRAVVVDPEALCTPEDATAVREGLQVDPVAPNAVGSEIQGNAVQSSSRGNGRGYVRRREEVCNASEGRPRQRRRRSTGENDEEEVLDLVSMQDAAAPRKGVYSYVYYAWDPEIEEVKRIRVRPDP